MDTQANDYSCYIRVNNKTDVDFGLTDTSVEYGEWPQGQPPNTIEANSSVDLRLKDKSGPSGSEGSATYSLELKKYPDTKITFKLNFSDPYSGWNDNFLGGSTNHPELISIHVHPYSKSGHPFYGEQQHPRLWTEGKTDIIRRGRHLCCGLEVFYEWPGRNEYC